MRRSEIWLINLDPAIGAEIKKTRPAVIVNEDTLGILPLRIIVPLTDWKDRYEQADWMVKVIPDPANNLSKTSAADCFQVRSLSKDRMVKKIGIIGHQDLIAISTALSKVLGIR